MTLAIRTLLLTGLLAIAGGRLATAGELPLVFQDDFEQGAGRWLPTDPQAWKLVDGPWGKAYSQHAQSKYKPPHRSPLNISLAKDVKVGSFVLDVKTRSTAREYGHRDVCLFFGYQDPSHFYYVHLGKKTDDHANQIFIVNNAPRLKISTETTPGTDWDDEWHHVRVRRDVDTGEIAIYFDDLEKPVMRAVDKTFNWGSIGLGTFDDTAEFDNVELRGVAIE